MQYIENLRTVCAKIRKNNIEHSERLTYNKNIKVIYLTNCGEAIKSFTALCGVLQMHHI